MVSQHEPHSLLTGIHPSMEAIKTGESLEDRQQREAAAAKGEVTSTMTLCPELYTSHSPP